MDARPYAHGRALTLRGMYSTAEALETARTLRVPGEVFLIDVADAEAAMALTQGIPMARSGSAEVRPVAVF